MIDDSIHQEFSAPDTQRLVAGRGVTFQARRADAFVRRALGMGAGTATATALVCAFTMAGMVKIHNSMGEVSAGLDALQQAPVAQVLPSAHACQENKPLAYCLPLRLRDGSLRMIQMEADGSLDARKLPSHVVEKAELGVIQNGVVAFKPAARSSDGKHLVLAVADNARVLVMEPSGGMVAARTGHNRFSLDLIRTVAVSVSLFAAQTPPTPVVHK